MGAVTSTQHSRAEASAGERLFGALSDGLGTDRWRLELWDGTVVAPTDLPLFTLKFTRRKALDRLLGDLPIRAFGRACVEGSIEVEPLDAFLRQVNDLPTGRVLRILPRLAGAAISLGARPDLRATAAESRIRGRRHSRLRDREAIRHHYDQPPEFYRIFLGRTMTYSCAYFPSPGIDVDTAQTAKLDLVCRKLRLNPGERFLDIGCGWGSLVFHAAQNYGVRAVGITTSPAQTEWARARAAALGLTGRVEIRLADYRDPMAETFDAIASVGMFEHVGSSQMRAYTDAIHQLLRPGGRALVHGITHLGAGSWQNQFSDKFVFPDAELQEVGRIITSLQVGGLEVRDVESLREHYALTLKAWVHRLESDWDQVVRLVGIERARVWRLYMSASRVSFEMGRIGVHQILVVRQANEGASGLPLTRDDWYDETERTSAATG